MTRVYWFLLFGPLVLFSDQVVTSTADSGPGTLRSAISTSPGNETITFSVSGTITLASELPSIDQTGLIIDGTGQTIVIDGASTYRPFFVNGAGCQIENLTVQNGKALGGTGGGAIMAGGGGAGLGGAVLVTSSGVLTLSNVTFSSNSAVGGNGGSSSGFGLGGGGGGGLAGAGGGNGETSNGGGGGGKLTANAGGDATMLSGGTGSGGGGDGGGSGTPATAGSDWGGGGGGDGSGFGSAAGGAGGYGGGGGGSGASGMSVTGGNGGYGGGGGGGAASGGMGGTNGGNGGVSPTASGGGGGAGLGANIFVQTGGSLTISNCNIPAGTVTAGSGGAGGRGVPGSDGQAAGTGYFVQSGTVNLNETGSNTVSGVIAGAAGISKTGTGSVTFSATNTYTGTTAVSAGTLVVTGSIATSSATTVSAGATLKGTGTVGPLTVNGTLQPGTSIGAITVASLTQSSGSTLAIEFNGTTTSTVTVTGAATIASNATLQLIPQAGSYTAGTVYPFLTAGTLTGTFDHLTLANNNLGFLTAELLPASGNTLSFVLVGGSNAQTAPVSITSSLAIGMNRAQMGFITEMQDQWYLVEPICCCNGATAEEICTNCGSGIKVCQQQRTYHPYLLVNYAKANISERKYTTRGSEQLWAGLLGVDFYVNSWFAAGVAGGYTGGHAKAAAAHQAKIDCNNVTANGYFQLNPVGKFYIDGGAVYGYSFYDSHRNSGGEISADFNGYELASQLRFLYQTCYKWVWARPYIAGTYYLNEIDSYTETQSAASGLCVGKDRFDFLDLEAGLYLWSPIRGGRWTFVPQASFGYVHSLLNSPHAVRAGTASSGVLVTTALFDNVSDHFWKFDGGVSFVFDNCADFFFNFNTVIDSAYDAPQEYSAGLEWAF